MNRRLKIIFFALFVVYLVFQVISFSLQGKKRLAWFERAIITITQPVQNLGYEAISEVGSWLHHYVLLTRTSQQNELLIERVEELVSALERMQEVEKENIRLRAILELAQSKNLSLLVAKRIALGSSPYQQSIRVRFRQEANVDQGQAVVHPRGAVGRISGRSGDTADVLLLTDKISVLDVINQRTRKRALLRGYQRNLLAFEYLPKGSDIQEGDELLTSGLDGVFPKGIPVGFVSKVRQGGKGLFIEAYVRPYVDFFSIEEVSIVRREPDA